jgi:hypothetical protein
MALALATGRVSDMMRGSKEEGIEVEIMNAKAGFFLRLLFVARLRKMLEKRIEMFRIFRSDSQPQPNGIVVGTSVFAGTPE